MSPLIRDLDRFRHGFHITLLVREQCLCKYMYKAKDAAYAILLFVTLGPHHHRVSFRPLCFNQKNQNSVSYQYNGTDVLSSLRLQNRIP